MAINPQDITERRRQAKSDLDSAQESLRSAEQALQAAHHAQHEALDRFNKWSDLERRALDGEEIPDPSEERAAETLAGLNADDKLALKRLLDAGA